VGVFVACISRVFSVLLFLAICARAQSLSGSVKDPSGAAIAGALVTHVPTGKTATTLADGSWTLSTIALRPQAGAPGPIRWRDGVLSYTLTGAGQRVEIGLFGAEGRKLKTLVERKMGAGKYVLDARQNLPAGHYLLKARIGGREMSFPLQVTDRSRTGETTAKGAVPTPAAARAIP
jgi:hypothetical protein